MKYSCVVLFLIFNCLAIPARADIVVVVNKDNPVEKLTSRDIISLYMGKKKAFPDGYHVAPIDQSQSSDIRQAFYQQLVGKSTAQINAYWARLLFTGKAEPPTEVRSSNELMSLVESNPHALAYIKESELTSDLKVVFRFEDEK